MAKYYHIRPVKETLLEKIAKGVSYNIVKLFNRAKLL